MTELVASNEEFLAKIFKHVKGQDGVLVAEEALVGKIIGLYFSAHWCGPCRQFTPQLIKKYESIIAEGQPFEILFVSSDEDEEHALEYYKDMPWKIISFDAEEIKEELSTKYQVRGIPSLVLVDTDGSTITTNGRSAITSVPFNKIKEFEAEQIAAAKKAAEELEALKKSFKPSTFFASQGRIIDQDGQSVSSSSFEGKIVGFYFSAHWCPPCRKFTPLLAEKYNSLVADNKPFEIIFISSDRDEASAKEYFDTMPWKMLSFEDRQLKSLLATFFQVQGIPMLILFDNDKGEIITDEGREAIMEVEFDKLKTFKEEQAAAALRLEEEMKSLPEAVKVPEHPHDLKKLPTVYAGRYGCDICGKGGQGWVYHCDQCGFDAHPKCASNHE